MILQEIELFNFKQYYGKQNIIFAGSRMNDHNNVTVIYGENGRGKTSLYRALMFAMYGDRYLEQDRSYEKNNQDPDSLYIVNTNALNDDFNDQQIGVEAYVKVNFFDNNKQYYIYRSMLGIQNSEQDIHEEVGELILEVYDSSGKIEHIEDDEEIENIINQILDRRVKDYFLFDGERIERLTKATKMQREEVARGIKNLLKIDELICAIETLNRLKRKLRKETMKISSGDYRKILKQLDELDIEREKTESKLVQLNKELKISKKDERDVENELAKYEEYKDLIRQRKSLNEQKEDLENNRKEISEKIKEFNNNAITLIGNDLLDNIFTDIETLNKKGIDSQVKNLLVELIEHEMKCICGTNLERNDYHHTKLLEWRDRIEDDLLDNNIKNFRDNLIKTRQFISDKKGRCSELLNSFAKIKEIIDEVNSKTERLDAEIGEVSDEDFYNKEQSRKKIYKTNTDLERKIEEKERELNKIERIIKELQNKKKQQEKENNIKNQFNIKSDLTEDTIKELEKIKEDFIKEVKDELEEEATKIFYNLIDPENRETFKKIIVNEDYSLDILDWNNRPFLANISAGQRQVMSLAFITALAKIAGGEGFLEMPLFMDTPFGRLSGKHRDNLLNEIPKLSPQWILLATDTEFTAVEAKELRETGKWGEVYTLNLVKEGYTKIERKEINNFKPNR